MAEPVVCLCGYVALMQDGHQGCKCQLLNLYVCLLNSAVRGSYEQSDLLALNIQIYTIFSFGNYGSFRSLFCRLCLV